LLIISIAQLLLRSFLAFFLLFLYSISPASSTLTLLCVLFMRVYFNSLALMCLYLPWLCCSWRKSSAPFSITLSYYHECIFPRLRAYLLWRS